MKGVRIAKPDFSTDSDPENLYVDSDTPIQKIAFQQAGTVTFTSADVDANKDVDFVHNLGYVPQWAVFAEYSPSSGVFRIASSSQISFVGEQIFTTTGINTTLLRIRFQAFGGGDPSGDYRYLLQIYHDEADDD